jgi:hypothetical protein
MFIVIAASLASLFAFIILQRSRKRVAFTAATAAAPIGTFL